MAKGKETLFKEKVLRDLRTLPLCYVDKIQQVAKRGSPDIYACIAGVFIAIELKKDEKARVAPLQWHFLTCIAEAGGIALLCYPENWQASFGVLQKIAEDKALELGYDASRKISSENH